MELKSGLNRKCISKNELLKRLLLCTVILGGGISLAGCSAVSVTKAVISSNDAEAEENSDSYEKSVKIEEEKVKEESKENKESESETYSITEENKEMQSIENKNSLNRKFSEGGALHVEGSELTDSTGMPIQLRGTSTHGLAWFPQYVNQEFFLELSSKWNVNVIRLAMYTAENGGYCTDGNKEEIKQLVKDGIRYATAADLYVIVDWHILSDGNPHTNKEEAKKFFEEISGEFGNQENIIYEICNEPNGNVSWADVKSYAEEVIPVIRANDEDAVIIVGTPNWSQDVDKAAADPITAYDNIMYALHFYAATHTDWLREKMVNALNEGLPIFVSEFGTCDASGSGSIDYAQSNAWIKKMDEHGVSYVTWNLSNKGETSAIFQSGCNKKSGFSEEDFSENGKWIFEMLTGEHIASSNAEQENHVVGSSEDIQYTAVISNHWEAEEKFFYQYSLTLKNISKQELNDWKISLCFSDAITLSDGWNADYTEKGNVLEITPKDYNSKIATNGEVSDIGFIISGSEGTVLLNE